MAWCKYYNQKCDHCGNCNRKGSDESVINGKARNFFKKIEEEKFGKEKKKRMKFKVGDRVKCIKPVDSNTYIVDKYGTVAQVLEGSTTSYGVLFDDYIGGHDVGVKDVYGRGWYCSEDSLVLVEEGISSTETDVEQKTDKPSKIKKLLFVEDGSVDVDTLTQALDDSDLGIYVVVYRQGSARPELIDLEER